MNEEKKKPTPEEVLMNVLADAGRIKRILIIVDSDNEYETWSNGLDLLERAGILQIATKRNDICIQHMSEVD